METTNLSSGAGRDPIELITEAFLHRFRRGERPSIDEFAATYPELADEIRRLLPALQQLERTLSVDGEATGSLPPAPRAETLRGAPRQLGDYTILREVGRGGMGVVYEAVQQSLGRHVALKVLPWQAIGTAGQLERFQLEARSAAKLHHTNIVPVFGVGESDGVHYYAMQFIHGQGLDAVIDELRRLREGGHHNPTEPAAGTPTIAATVAREWLGGPATATLAAGAGATQAGSASTGTARPVNSVSTLTSQSDLTGAHDRRYYQQAARLALQVAEGLAYAHDQGVLHRDIKPSNLLVDTRGTVWITDFGLAKAEGSDGPTRTGDVLGTLRYMAPERFEGHSDRRSDVYSLGATLYELVTLQPLFGDVNRAKLIDQIQHEPPPPPRRLDRRVPRDLETIILKSLAKEPAQRYRDALALADDLRRFIEDRPILTRRVSTTEQIWRWCRRNPLVAGLAATILVLLAGGAIAGGVAANYYWRLAYAATEARLRADNLAEAERQANERATREASEAKASRAQADAKAREAQAVADFFVMDLIGTAAPGKGQGTETTIGEALSRADASIDKRFAGEPVLAAAIHHQMGETYWHLGNVLRAESHFRTASDLRLRYLGPDARETLSSRMRLMIAIRGKSAGEARTIGQDVLERQRRVLGPEDPDTLVTTLEIGPLLFPSGDARATEYYRQVHESLARVNGSENIVTINALHFYGESFRDQNQYDRAAEVLRQVLELRLRTVGEVHSTTFWAETELCEVDRLARRYDVAWEDAERFWPVMCRSMDPANVQFERMTWVLLDLAGEAGWSRAESLVRRQADALSTELGPDHIRTLFGRALLARVLAEQHRADEALAVARDVLEKSLGQKRRAGDVPVFVQAITAVGLSGGLGSGHDETTRKRQETLIPLVLAALNRLDLQASRSPERWNEWAWLLVSTSSSPLDPRIASFAVGLARAATRAEPRESRTRNTLGVALYRAGDWSGAVAELEKSIRLSRDQAAYAYNGFFLAMAHWRQGDRQKALAYFDRSIRWMDALAPSDLLLIRLRAEAAALLDLSVPHPDASEKLGDFSAEVYFEMGKAAGARGKWPAALADLRRAFDRQAARDVVPSRDELHSQMDLYLAIAELELGDRAAYLRYCQAMLDRFGTSATAAELERTAKAALLWPPSSPEKREQLRTIARAAVDRIGSDGIFLDWMLLARGLAEYRTGDQQAALETLDDCLKLAPAAPIQVPALAIQAMALHRQGHAAPAREHLDLAERLLAERLPTMAARDWPDRLVARRLVREAQAVIRFDPIFPADPFAP